MRTRYGASPWIHEFPDSRRPAYPPLRGEQRAPVIIIGGGLTGCATAYACAVAGFRPIVVERDRIGTGRTGRGAGLLLPEPGPQFRDIAAAHGLRAARRIFETWRRTSLDAAALIRRLGVRADLEPCDTVTAAFGTGDRLLRRDFDARHDAGLDVHWLGPRQARQLTQLEFASAALRLSD